jgi:hypothetical protein
MSRMFLRVYIHINKDINSAKSRLHMLREKVLYLMLLAAAACAAQQPSASVPQPPESFNKMVRSHVAAMMKEGYAQELSWDDLNHGHIFAPSREGCYSSLDSLLGDVKQVLYHTRRYKYDWVYDESPEKKTQRSIVGFKDGTITPAIEFVGKENLASRSIFRFNRLGLIDVEDVTKVRPDLSHDGHYTCVVVGGQNRNVSFEFHIDENMKVSFGMEYPKYPRR